MEKQHAFPYKAHLYFFLLYFLSIAALFWFANRNNGFQSGFSLTLLWNCFLSFLPVLFARLAVAGREKKNHIWPLWMFLWIAFWPNTFYLVTDVIHFTGNTLYDELPYQNPVYSTQIQLWVTVILIIAGILYGIINGVTSELILEEHIISPYGNDTRVVFRAICSILGGAGIYIGRFLRFNSWDIFRPAKLWNAIRYPQYRMAFILSFSGAFAVFIFFVLCISKSLVDENTK